MNAFLAYASLTHAFLDVTNLTLMGREFSRFCLKLQLIPSWNMTRAAMGFLKHQAQSWTCIFYLPSVNVMYPGANSGSLQDIGSYVAPFHFRYRRTMLNLRQKYYKDSLHYIYRFNKLYGEIGKKFVNS